MIYDQARYYKKYGCSPIIRQRMYVLYLRAKGLPPRAYAWVTDVPLNSVTRWTKCYMEHGLGGLLAVKPYRPKSDLITYADKIKAEFDKDLPRAASHARKRIEQLTGLKRGITQIRKFVKDVLKFRSAHYRYGSNPQKGLPSNKPFFWNRN